MAYISAGSLQNGGSSTFVETFVDATDYTSGTTTQLTLVNTPASQNTVWVVFDGVAQHHTEYSISANVITFANVIPLGINAVEVQNNTELKLAVPGDDSVTTAKVVDGAIEYDKLAQAVKDVMGPQNVIINGNFDIWQRGTTLAAITTSVFLADRFEYKKTGSGAVHTASRSTTVPTYAESGTRSNYSYKLDITTADVTVAIGDSIRLQYKVEGYDYARIAGGDATLSFWVNGTKTGIHCVSFKNTGVDRTYVAEYTINTTNTWEKKTITVPLTETGGTWDYTNGNGLTVGWSLVSGTTYHTTADAWQTGNYYATSNQVNAVDDVANNFHIAQVQLERGNIATEFEVKNFSDEVARCQRYYDKSFSTDIAPDNEVESNNATHAGVNFTTNAVRTNRQTFAAEMRDTPTILLFSSSGVGTAVDGQWSFFNTSWSSGSSTIRLDEKGLSVDVVTSGIAVGTALLVAGFWTADAEL